MQSHHHQHQQQQQQREENVKIEILAEPLVYDDDDDDDTTVTTDFDFLSLPTELKRRTAYFLATRDVLHLSQTCRLLQQSLVLRRLLPLRHLTCPPPPNPQTDDILQLRRVVARIPIWNRRVHSVTLTVNYQQNNATQRATCLYVSAYPTGAGAGAASNNNNSSSTTTTPTTTTNVPLTVPGDDDDNDGGDLGRIVASTTSPWGRGNEPATWHVRWSPLEGEIYYLWYASSSVRVLQLTLETRLLDDHDGIVARQYTKLASLGVLCCCDQQQQQHSNNGMTANPQPTLFYPQLLLHVAQSLRTTATTGSSSSSSSSLIQFWQQQAGLSLETRALLATEEILQADLEERTWRMVEQAEAAAAAADTDETH